MRTRHPPSTQSRPIPHASRLATNATTRQKLIDDCARLFSPRGFEVTNTGVLAAEAGVNLAATSNHFGGKEGRHHTVATRIVTEKNGRRRPRIRAAVQGRAACFVTRINGSYTNVVGLQLAEVVAALGKGGTVEQAR